MLVKGVQGGTALGEGVGYVLWHWMAQGLGKKGFLSL